MKHQAIPAVWKHCPISGCSLYKTRVAGRRRLLRKEVLMDVSVEVIHEHLLKLMKDFHQMCVNNNITYYMIGGTCLGALRHHGFIPWDDDIDVGIPRDDYERLKTISLEEFPNDTEFRYYENTVNSPMHYIKFIDSSTTLIERKYENYVEGLYIDVFPLDFVPVDDGMRRKLLNRTMLLHAIIMNHYSTTPRTGLKRRLVHYIISKFNGQSMHNRLEKMMTSNCFESTLVCNLLGAHGEKEVVPRKVFGKPVLYPFEDTMLYGPEDACSYLTCVYGDWQELPPKSEQIPRHDYLYLDLAQPYRQYLL